jgi:hypothetical protein
MSGPAYSTESPDRRILRFAIGVTLAFGIGQLIGWPLAHLFPVFVALLLLGGAPISMRQALIILLIAGTTFAAGFWVTYILSAYPSITLLVFVVLGFWFFYLLLRSGVHSLAIIGMLIGTMIIPVLVRLLPEVAVIAGAGLFIDLALSIGVAWAAFFVVRSPADRALVHPSHPGHTEALSMALSIMAVIAPLMVAFLYFGWTDILILVYGVIFATAMSASGGAQQGQTSAIANIIYGGIGMLVTYELLVIVPVLPFMLVLFFFVCVLYGWRIFSGRYRTGYWVSGFIGLLILLGGALLADDGVSAVKVFGRVFQIVLATLYVTFAYNVIDLIKRGIAHASANRRILGTEA